MHTNIQAVALFIATAIYPLESCPTWEQRCDILYDTIDQLLFSDELKADLYARLAEQLDAKTKFSDALRIIARAIHACLYRG